MLSALLFCDAPDHLICVDCDAGARPYMEDRHTIVANYSPIGRGGFPEPDGVLRSYAAVFDGHNGSLSAEEAASR